MVKNAIKFLITPCGLLVLAIIMLLMGHVVFKKRFLNCKAIIRKHFECFKKKDGKYSFTSIFLYFGVPCIIALALVQIRPLDETVINILTIIISILTSMLFTMLTLILDMRKRIKQDKTYNANDVSISTKLLKETYYSVMFEILVSIVILFMCFIELFSQQFANISSCMIYYLTFVLLMNLFMVLKRIFNVIDNDINVQDK